MIRKGAFAISVKAPSRGLVTRWPSETADRFTAAQTDLASLYTGMVLKRACAVAQNVRFEDGVMCAAPGYQKIQYSTTLLANCIAHWRMDEASGTRVDLFGTYPALEVSPAFATPGKLGYAVVLDQSFGGELQTSIPLPLTAGHFTISGWVNFSDLGSGHTVFSYPSGNVSLNTSGNQLAFTLLDFVGIGSTAVTVTSAVAMSTGTWYFFVVYYDGANIGIRVNATTNTAAFAPVITETSGQLVFGSADNGPFDLDSVTCWTRALSSGEQATVYNSGNGLDFPFLNGAITLLYEGNIIATPNRPTLFGTPGTLFAVTKAFTASPPTYTATLQQLFPGVGGSPIPPATPYHNWRACDFYDKIVAAQESNKPQYWAQDGTNLTHDVPGLDVSYATPANGPPWFEGCETFFGHLIFWQNDQIVWSDVNDFGNYIPVAATAVSAVFTPNANFTQPAANATVDITFTGAIASALAVGQFVRLIQAVGGVNTYNYYQVDGGAAPTTTTARLKLLDKTGRIASGNTVTAAQFTTCDANEAGAASTVGSLANGPIFQVVALGDYAYVFKEFSIQSLQYVGQGSGTFFMRTEVVREGLIGRNSWTTIGNGSVVFLGHRELYNYSGGPTPTAVCRQYTRQLFAELDRSKLDQILLFHRERRNEIWIVYPVQGGQKVLIWNYVEDTASLDVYDPALSGLTAFVRTTWATDPAWLTGSMDQTWVSFSSDISWSSFAGTGADELAIIGTGDSELLIHGTVYDRNGQAYMALAETMDYDADNPGAFKYVDVARVSLQVLATDNATRTLYVQLGYRSTLDAAITWSTPQAIQVQGGANFTAKINPGSGGGRYLRLRFYSQDVDVAWRISSFDIFGRMGGTY